MISEDLFESAWRLIKAIDEGEDLFELPSARREKRKERQAEGREEAVQRRQERETEAFDSSWDQALAYQRLHDVIMRHYNNERLDLVWDDDDLTRFAHDTLRDMTDGQMNAYDREIEERMQPYVNPDGSRDSDYGAFAQGLQSLANNTLDNLHPEGEAAFMQGQGWRAVRDDAIEEEDYQEQQREGRSSAARSQIRYNEILSGMVRERHQKQWEKNLGDNWMEHLRAAASDQLAEEEGDPPDEISDGSGFRPIRDEDDLGY